MAGDDRKLADSANSNSRVGVFVLRTRNSISHSLLRAAMSIGAAAAHCGTGAAFLVSADSQDEDDSPNDSNESDLPGE